MTFVSEIEIPLPPVWSLTKSRVLIYTGASWFAMTSFKAVPLPLTFSVKTPSFQLPLTTEPLVTTKSFGMLILPTSAPPCLIV